MRPTELLMLLEEAKLRLKSDQIEKLMQKYIDLGEDDPDGVATFAYGGQTYYKSS